MFFAFFYFISVVFIIIQLPFFRLLKETNSRSPRSDPNNNELKETKRILVSNQSENKLLRATIDRMQAQLAYYEECHNKNNKPSQVL